MRDKKGAGRNKSIVHVCGAWGCSLQLRDWHLTGVLFLRWCSSPLSDPDTSFYNLCPSPNTPPPPAHPVGFGCSLPFASLSHQVVKQRLYITVAVQSLFLYLPQKKKTLRSLQFHQTKFPVSQSWVIKILPTIPPPSVWLGWWCRRIMWG